METASDIPKEQSDAEVADAFIVESENWLAWCVFRECATQWRYSFAGPTGLDYSAVIGVMNVMGVRHQQATLRRIKLMESGAMAGFRGVTRDELEL